MGSTFSIRTRTSWTMNNFTVNCTIPMICWVRIHLASKDLSSCLSMMEVSISCQVLLKLKGNRLNFMNWILCKEQQVYGGIGSDLLLAKVLESSNKTMWISLSTRSKFFLHLIASMHLVSKAVPTAAFSSAYTASFSWKNQV